MSEKLKEFVRQSKDKFLKGLTPEERLEGLPAEVRLYGSPRQEIEDYFKRLQDGATPTADPGSKSSA